MDSAPAALVAKKMEGNMRFAFGWTMATSKRHLAEIGGWEQMANFHSDDFELGNRIARSGHRIELMKKPVSMVFPKETLSEHFRRELRWSIGLRSVRPLGYWGLLFTHGLPWALLAAAAAVSIGSIQLALSYLAAYMILRVGLTWTTGKWGLGDRQLLKILWLVPLRDALSFIIWISGFFTNKITWRGLTYHVKHGQLIPIPSQSHATPLRRNQFPPSSAKPSCSRGATPRSLPSAPTSVIQFVEDRSKTTAISLRSAVNNQNAIDIATIYMK